MTLLINGGFMYQPQVLGEQFLPNTGSSDVAFIAGIITLAVGAAIVITTVLRVVAKRKANKA